MMGGARRYSARFADDHVRLQGLALTGVMALARGGYSIGAFVTNLIARLSYGDPTLRPLADRAGRSTSLEDR